ncbi:MAG: hypothetical protein AB1422_05140 [bacterium]
MNSIIITALSAQITAILVVIFSTFFAKRKETQTGRSKFFESLDKKFDIGFVKDRSDIEILKSAIEREAGAVYSLAPLLEDYLVHLTHKGTQESTDTTLSERYQIIKEIIVQENADKPFADVPEEERQLLIRIRDGTQHNDKESILFNLNELSSVISVRTKDYERTMKTNRWAVPLAVIGLLASIVFGAFSLLK